jgi:hypothetical protein
MYEDVLVEGTNQNHAPQNLYKAITQVNYLDWMLCIQTMDPIVEEMGLTLILHMRLNFSKGIYFLCQESIY